MEKTPEPFAKLFDTPEGQLLVALVTTDDDEPGILVRAADIEGVTVQATLSGWDDEQGQRKGFAAFDQVGAEDIAKRLRNTVRDMGFTDRKEQS